MCRHTNAKGSTCPKEAADMYNRLPALIILVQHCLVYEYCCSCTPRLDVALVISHLEAIRVLL